MDLISRTAIAEEMEELIEIIKTYPATSYNEGFLNALKRASVMIAAQPAIDAVPVVHGNYTLAFSEEENVWKCSNCGDYWLLNDGTPFDNEMNFCPKCGARMDGKKNEEVPVIVVRCKNCKHWGMGIAGETDRIKCCMYARYMVGENGYCVYGEKEGAE